MQVFERLKNKTDVAEQQRQQDELNARLHAQQNKSQERLGELVCQQLMALGLALKCDAD
jgi:outer membrane protein insertion porin family